jgi:hypothetical protein
VLEQTIDLCQNLFSLGLGLFDLHQAALAIDRASKLFQRHQPGVERRRALVDQLDDQQALRIIGSRRYRRSIEFRLGAC